MFKVVARASEHEFGVMSGNGLIACICFDREAADYICAEMNASAKMRDAVGRFEEWRREKKNVTAGTMYARRVDDEEMGAWEKIATTALTLYGADN